MPSYVRVKKDAEELFEVLLDPPRVYIAEGSRAVGESQWNVKQTYPRCHRFDNAAEAQAFYENRVSKLPKAYRRVAEHAPECEAYRDKSTRERDGLLASMRAWEQEHHQVAELEAKGKVYWTGKTPSNVDQFWELVLDGNNVIVRSGTMGKGRPRTETESHPDRASAVSSAQISMMTAMNILKFGP